MLQRLGGSSAAVAATDSAKKSTQAASDGTGPFVLAAVLVLVAVGAWASPRVTRNRRSGRSSNPAVGAAGKQPADWRAREDGARGALVTPEWLGGLAGFAAVLLAGVGWFVRECLECKRPVIGLPLMIAAAAFMSGFLLGVLFGIPRSVRVAPIGDGTTARRQERAFLDNTNLEEISDWLTKLLVGVGLAKLNAVEPAVDRLTSSFDIAFGNVPGGGVFGVAVALYAIVSGFLFGYSWARIVLPQALAAASVGPHSNDSDRETHDATRP